MRRRVVYALVVMAVFAIGVAPVFAADAAKSGNERNGSSGTRATASPTARCVSISTSGRSVSLSR